MTYGRELAQRPPQLRRNILRELIRGLTEHERNLIMGDLSRLEQPIASTWGFASPSTWGTTTRSASFVVYVERPNLERARTAIFHTRVRPHRVHYVPGTDVMLLSRPTKMPGPSWSLPAGRGDQDHPGACPFMYEGPNTICGRCYALGGRYVDEQHQAAMQARFAWVRQCLRTPEGTERFVAEMADAIRDAEYRYMRVHDSGDLFSDAYTRAWARIAGALPQVHFWIPTRSWRAPWLESIVGLNALPNVAVRPSALHFDDPPPSIAGLAAGTSVTRGEAYTCPAPRQGHSCGTCRVCWDHPEQPVIYRETGFARFASQGDQPMTIDTTNGHSNGHVTPADLPIAPEWRPPEPARQSWVDHTAALIADLERRVTEHEDHARAELAEADRLRSILIPLREAYRLVDPQEIRELEGYSAAAPAAAQATKRWARDYDQCRNCHRTDRRHLGKGYCEACYQANRWRDQSAELALGRRP